MQGAALKTRAAAGAAAARMAARAKKAKKAKTTKKDVALLEDTLKRSPFVPDEGPGDSARAARRHAQPGRVPGAFAAIKRRFRAVRRGGRRRLRAGGAPVDQSHPGRRAAAAGAGRRRRRPRSEAQTASRARAGGRRRESEIGAELRLQTARARDEVAAASRSRPRASWRAPTSRSGRPCRRSRRRRSRLLIEDCDAVEGVRRLRGGRAADPRFDRIQRRGARAAQEGRGAAAAAAGTQAAGRARGPPES